MHIPVHQQNSTAKLKRRLKTIGIIFLISAVLLVVGFRAAHQLSAEEPQLPKNQAVIVQPGDTLWSIAQRLAPDADPRPLIDKLTQSLGTANLQAGQEIVFSGP